MRFPLFHTPPLRILGNKLGLCLSLSHQKEQALSNEVWDGDPAKARARSQLAHWEWWDGGGAFQSHQKLSHVPEAGPQSDPAGTPADRELRAALGSSFHLC